jgi:hypothetical protein
VGLASAPAGPYRESAAPGPPRPARWLRRLVTAGIACAALAGGAYASWRAIPWQRSAELRATRERLPPHEPIASVWWSDDGWALAVGAKGQVLVRGAETDGTAPWTALDSHAEGDLVAVAGGRFETGRWPGPAVFAIAVGDGSVLACTPDRCRRLSSGANHRAVAWAGGEAIVVGDGGSVVRVVSWYTSRGVPLGDGSGVTTWPMEGLALTADLRTLRFSCDETAERCDATVASADGVVARGERTGACDDGQRVSGSMLHWCSWKWTVLPAPAPLPPEAGLRVWATIDVVSTKPLATTRDRSRGQVTFGVVPHAQVDGASLLLRTDRRFVAASTPFDGLGDETLLVDDAGDVYLAPGR